MNARYQKWPKCGVIAQIDHVIGIDFKATCASRECETEIEAEKDALMRMEIFCLSTARIAREKYEHLAASEKGSTQ